MQTSLLFLLVTFLVASYIPLFGGTIPLSKYAEVKDKSNVLEYEFNWNEVSGFGDKLTITSRITSDNIVKLRIRGVNWFRYKVVSNIKRDTALGYNALESMWKQLIFPLTTTQINALAAANNFLPQWKLVLEEMNRIKDSVQKLSTTVPKTVEITDKDSIEILQSIERLRVANDALEDKFKLLYSAFINETTVSIVYFEKQLYDYAYDIYTKQQLTLKEIYKVEKLFRNGYVIDCGQSGSGILNTVQITLTDIDGVDNSSISLTRVRKSFDVMYFVNSKIPVLFHVGAFYSTMKDINVQEYGKTLNSIQQINLFKADTTNQSPGIVAFMSYSPDFASTFDQSTAVMLTLGTGLAKPGELLLIGLSLKAWDNYILTVGAQTKQVKQTDEATKQTIDGVNVFKTVKEATDWGFFFGVSIAPF